MIVDVNRLVRPSDIRSRVWLDDIEVTTDCFYADDEAGIVRLYQRNSSGRIPIGKPWVEKHGQVKIERPPEGYD